MPAAPKPPRREPKRLAFGSTMPAPSKGIAPFSAKGKATRDDWHERRDAHLAENPTCVLTQLSACFGRLDVHHIEPRGMGGSRKDSSPLATLCRKHHNHVEANREWARGCGLLIRKGGQGDADGGRDST